MRAPAPGITRGILTDVQFWLPVAVLLFGVGLLLWIARA
jgi:hypothetical protein